MSNIIKEQTAIYYINYYNYQSISSPEKKNIHLEVYKKLAFVDLPKHSYYLILDSVKLWKIKQVNFEERNTDSKMKMKMKFACHPYTPHSLRPLKGLYLYKHVKYFHN